MNTGTKTENDVTTLLRARNTLLWVVSREEERVERSLIAAAKTAGYEVRLWDCATGVTDGVGTKVNDRVKDPAAVLRTIGESRKKELWVLRDLHPWLRDPTVCRQVRSLARELEGARRTEARAMAILTPSGEIPLELSGAATVVDWPLPDREEVRAILEEICGALPSGVTAPDTAVKDAAVDAAVGLTAHEAANCYARSIVAVKKIDPTQIIAEKRRVIARERVLEWHEPDPRGLEAVGGLDALKAWLNQRRAAFSQRARDFGLPPPKGVLLGGVPGCGKSLTAKAIAAAWQVPLLRLDMGALRSKWVGESESNLRRALAVAEAVAPCVLWLDEMEKALGGAITGAADGGVSADALGAVLSWMQEKTAPVFVVATSNEVRLLPPELLRKGRFDEVFWVDLPTEAERKAVLETALTAHRRTSEGLDLDRVVSATHKFTGAEVAQLIPEALFEAFADGERPITSDDLIRAAAAVTPLANTADDRLEALRTWAKGRARSASVSPRDSRDRVSVTDISSLGLRTSGLD